MVDIDLHSKDHMKGCLVRFWDKEFSKVRFGVCDLEASDDMYFIFRISQPILPYGIAATKAIRVRKIDITKKFGVVEFNSFIKSHPEWLI